MSSPLRMHDKDIGLKGWMHDKQIIVNGQKLIKRVCRTWVQCSKCGVDIKTTDKERRYWETSSHYRLCIKCMLSHLEQAKMIERL